MSDFDYAAQAIAATLLVDTCTVTAAPTGPGTLHETTLAVTFPYGAQLYEGPCSVAAAKARPTQHGGADVAQAELIVKIPADTPAGIRPGAIVTITASLDPDLVGVDLEVVDVELATYRLTRRLGCRRRVAFARTGGAA